MVVLQFEEDVRSDKTATLLKFIFKFEQFGILLSESDKRNIDYCITQSNLVLF